MARQCISYILSLLLIFHSGGVSAASTGLGSITNHFTGERACYKPGIELRFSKAFLAQDLTRTHSCSENNRSSISNLLEKSENESFVAESFCYRIKQYARSCNVPEVKFSSIQKFHKEFSNDPKVEKALLDKDKKQLAGDINRYERAASIQTAFLGQPSLIRNLKALLGENGDDEFKEKIAGELGKETGEKLEIGDFFQCKAGNAREIYSGDECQKEEVQNIFSKLREDCINDPNSNCGINKEDGDKLKNKGLGLLELSELKVASKVFGDNDLDDLVKSPEKFKKYIKDQGDLNSEHYAGKRALIKKIVEKEEGPFKKYKVDYKKDPSRGPIEEGFYLRTVFAKAYSNVDNRDEVLREIDKSSPRFNSIILSRRLEQFSGSEESRLSSPDANEFNQIATKYKGLSEDEKKELKEGMESYFTKAFSGSSDFKNSLERLPASDNSKAILGSLINSSYVKRVRHSDSKGNRERYLKNILLIPNYIHDIDKGKKLNKAELAEFLQIIQKDPILGPELLSEHSLNKKGIELSAEDAQKIAEYYKKDNLFSIEDDVFGSHVGALVSVKIRSLVKAARDCNLNLKKNVKKFCERKRGGDKEISIGDAKNTIFSKAKNSNLSLEEGITGCFIYGFSTKPQEYCKNIITRANNISREGPLWRSEVRDAEAYRRKFYKDNFHIDVSDSEKKRFKEIFPSAGCDAQADPDNYHTEDPFLPCKGEACKKNKEIGSVWEDKSRVSRKGNESIKGLGTRHHRNEQKHCERWPKSRRCLEYREEVPADIRSTDSTKGDLPSSVPSEADPNGDRLLSDREVPALNNDGQNTNQFLGPSAIPGGSSVIRGTAAVSESAPSEQSNDFSARIKGLEEKLAAEKARREELEAAQKEAKAKESSKAELDKLQGEIDESNKLTADIEKQQEKLKREQEKSREASAISKARPSIAPANNRVASTAGVTPTQQKVSNNPIISPQSSRARAPASRTANSGVSAINSASTASTLSISVSSQSRQLTSRQIDELGEVLKSRAVAINFIEQKLGKEFVFQEGEKQFLATLGENGEILISEIELVDVLKEEVIADETVNKEENLIRGSERRVRVRDFDPWTLDRKKERSPASSPSPGSNIFGPR